MAAEPANPTTIATSAIGRAGDAATPFPAGAQSPTRSSSPTVCAGSFGGIIAVDVDHVEIQRGSITALIGPNGAGKTTFFNLLTGFDDPNQGNWSFNGKSLDGVAAHKVAALGHGPHLSADQEPDARCR